MYVAVQGEGPPHVCGSTGGGATTCMWQYRGRGHHMYVAVQGEGPPHVCGSTGGGATTCMWQYRGRGHHMYVAVQGEGPPHVCGSTMQYTSYGPCRYVNSHDQLQGFGIHITNECMSQESLLAHNSVIPYR